MKKLKFNFGLFMLLIAVSAIKSNAQIVTGGIGAGVSLNSVKLETSFHENANNDKVNGVEAGLFLNIDFGGLYIRPSASAGFLKGNVKSAVNEETTLSGKFSLTTLETPVLLGLRLLPVIAIEAGPSWSYLLNYSKELNGAAVDFSRNTLGYRAGVRVTFSQLGFFGHYRGMITENRGEQFNLQRPSGIVFGMTLNFGGSN